MNLELATIEKQSIGKEAPLHENRESNQTETK
jgi:hypothetical protein